MLALTPEQIERAAELVRSGASDGATAEMIEVPEEQYLELLDAGRAGDPAGAALWEAVQKARTHARLQAEVDLKKRNPALWLKLQAQLPKDAMSGVRHLKQLLGLPRFAEIDARLRDGQTAEHVAQVLHEEMHVMEDVPRQRVEWMLKRYLIEVVGVAPPPPADPETERTRIELEKRLTELVDVGERLTWLVNVQTERVRLAADGERNGQRVGNLFLDVNALRGALDSLLEYQLETGLVERRRGKTGEDQAVEDAARVLEAANEKRLKGLRGAAQLLLTHLEKKEG